MEERTARRIGAWLVIVLLIVLALGIIIAGTAVFMPEYNDEVAAQALIVTGDNRYWNDTAQWHAEMDALRTAKWDFFDIGVGAALVACCLLVFFVAFRLRDIRNIARIRTPKRRWVVLVWVVLSWLALAPAWCYSGIFVPIYRRYVPVWADSPGIPLTGIVTVVGLGLPIVSVIAMTILWKARLPESLWIWTAHRPLRFGLYTGGAALLMAFLLLWLVLAVLGGAHFDIPIIFSFAYLVLVMRSAALSRYADGCPGQAQA